MRIIAGKHKGRRIEVGKDPAGLIRPTSDFAREAIFNILMHGRYAGHLVGRPVLDLFCGSGALGLEALSRGAAHVTFIDSAREALAAARHNAQRMGETAAEFLQADAGKLPRARRAYALIFLDPPYFGKLTEPALMSLKAGGWADEDTLLVLEQDAKETLAPPSGYRLLDARRYGRASVKLLALDAAPS